MSEKWGNADTGGDVIGRKAEEYWLIEIADDDYGLFTEHDLVRPRQRHQREGSPEPRLTLAGVEEIVEAQRMRIVELMNERAEFKRVETENQRLNQLVEELQTPWWVKAWKRVLS